MVKENIETVIDRLAEYVKVNGEVTLNDTAAALGRQPNQIERLALLLEENGLVEVRYTLSGVKLVAVSSEEEKEKPPQRLAGGPASAVVDRLMEESDELEREVLTSGSLLQFFETDLERRNKKAESLLEDLELREDFTAEELQHIKNEVDLAIKQLDSFSEEIKKLAAREDHFKEKLSQFKQRMEKIKAKTPAEVAEKQAEPKTLPEKILRMLDELAEKLEKILSAIQNALLAGKKHRPTSAGERRRVGEKKAGRTPLVVEAVAEGKRQSSISRLLAPIEEKAVKEISRTQESKEEKQAPKAIEPKAEKQHKAASGVRLKTERQLMKAPKKTKPKKPSAKRKKTLKKPSDKVLKQTKAPKKTKPKKPSAKRKKTLKKRSDKVLKHYWVTAK